MERCAAPQRHHRRHSDDTMAVQRDGSRGSTRRALRRHRPERCGQDDMHPDDHVDPLSGCRRAVGARPSVGARGQGPHRLPAGGARRLSQDACRRVSHLHRPAEGAERETRRRRAARELLERVGLPETWSKRCEDLSKGMLQRVQIAAAIIHHPDLLILDEPFSGLDPVSVRLLRDLDPRRASPRRDDSVLDACDGSCGGDLPARGDDSSGAQGARRADGARCAGGSIRGRCASSRSMPTPTWHPARAARGGADRAPGCRLRGHAPRGPTRRRSCGRSRSGFRSRASSCRG